MKTVLLMRHAKSSWKDMTLADHDRPLNRRGREAAPMMGEWLAGINLVPEIILCSSANRARQTVKYLLHTLPFEGDVHYTRNLYHSGPQTYMRELQQLDQTVDVAMIVGHNPGMEYALEEFTGEWEPLPTAAIAYITFDLNDWGGILADETGMLKNVWRPKEI